MMINLKYNKRAIYQKSLFSFGMVAILMSWLACNHDKKATGQEGSIDRKAVVRRHNVINNTVDSLASLTVGNGEFAFTVDVTGLQTFPLSYQHGVALGTQSEWGWDSFKNDKNYQFEETLKSYDFNQEGRKALYSVQWEGPSRHQAAADWFRANPHRLQLANIGFELYKKDGSLARPSDLQQIKQELDLWTGIVHSSFQLEGTPVEVYTAAHQEQDQIAVQVHSPLIRENRLHIYVRYPYPTAAFLDEGTNWGEESLHETNLIAQDRHHAWVKHQLQGSVYHTGFAFSEGTFSASTTPHYYIFEPAKGQTDMEFSAYFSQSGPSRTAIHSYKETLQSSTKGWEDFWKRGAAIDFAGSTDPRAHELERRVILSEYLTKVQCAGHYPPQETGLTFNSWFGKLHTEMHWWHAVHFALWGRVDLMEKSLAYYVNTLDKAKAIARRQGYAGVRWQKMADNEGDESPSSVAPFLIWQQPHFIYLAELAYRDRQDPKIIEKYKDIVFATADFMASFPTYDKTHDRYNLGKGLIPAQEVFKADETYNPTYELAYWDWALRTAQQWRKRAGLPVNKKWEEVIQKLAALPVQGEVYLATESAKDSYTYPRWKTDHPVVLGALGMVPESPKLDKEVMKNTLDTVWSTWSWKDTWGWDFPMTAMTAARLGLSQKALDALFMKVQKNTYLKNGHNYQDQRLRIYLPGNGGLLTAIAMMAGGWDGSQGLAPGFPKDGTWKVKAEGFKPMP